jgi:hypothetical protein
MSVLPKLMKLVGPAPASGPAGFAHRGGYDRILAHIREDCPHAFDGWLSKLMSVGPK